MTPELTVAVVSGIAGLAGAGFALLQSLRVARLKSATDLTLQRLKDENEVRLRAMDLGLQRLKDENEMRLRAIDVSVQRLKDDNEARVRAFQIAREESAPVEKALAQMWSDIQMVKEGITTLANLDSHGGALAVASISEATGRLVVGYGEWGGRVPSEIRDAWHKAKERAKDCATVLNELQAKHNAQNLSLTLEAIEDLKEARLALTDMQLRLQNAPHSTRQRLLEESLGLMTEGRATRYEDFESVQIFRKTEPENSATRATSPVRILLVEDDENVRETSQFIYEQEGHVCEVADTCEGALRLLAGGGPFDIIHIHRGLPDMDAFSFVRALRSGAGEARGTSRDTPIFVVTGAFEREDIARYRSAFDAAVARPANPAALRRLVRILTRGRR